MFEEIDFNKNGEISFIEFKSFCTGMPLDAPKEVVIYVCPSCDHDFKFEAERLKDSLKFHDLVVEVVIKDQHALRINKCGYSYSKTKSQNEMVYSQHNRPTVEDLINWKKNYKK